MPHSFRRIPLFAALLLIVNAAHALSLGRPSNVAVLGQTLDLAVPLVLDAGEDLRPNCLGSDVYFGDNKLPAPVVSVEAEGTDAHRTLHILTTRRIDEPVVTVYLTVGCTTQVTRKFVAFADPPELHAPEVVAPESNAAAPATAASTVTKTVSPPAAIVPQALTGPSGGQTPAGVQAGGEGAAQRAPKTLVQSGPEAVAAAPAASQAATARRRRAPARAAQRERAPSTAANAAASRVVAAVPHRSLRLDQAKLANASAGSSLHVDAIETDAVISPALRMALTMAAPEDGSGADSKATLDRRAAAAALWRSMNATPEEMAQDRQRLQELEDRLAQLRKETAGARETVTTLRARVEKAESQRWANPVVYSLLALCAALGAGLVWLWRSRSQDQQAWWTPSQAEAQASQSPGSTLKAGVEPKIETKKPVADENKLSAAPGAPAKATVTPGPSTARPAAPAAAATPAAKPKDEIASPFAAPQPAAKPTAAKALQSVIIQAPPREVSVEELIDLEQQAEFFVVLGQDQAAIDLLEGHVRSTTGASPLPYLKLMEIYQRRGERESYESIREMFNERFNSYAPAWESDMQHGHTLDGYSGVVERLQSLWQKPSQAMEVLQASLLRQDKDAETFDLPAYRELLFLYGIARDLSEHTEEGVDLLLPIDSGAAAPAASSEAVQPLLATRSIKASPELRPALTVDLDLDAVAGKPSADAPRGDRGADDSKQ